MPDTPDTTPSPSPPATPYAASVTNAMSLRAIILCIGAAIAVIFVGNLRAEVGRFTILLLFGWLSFLPDVIPRLELNVAGVITAFVALTLVMLGSHWLILWLRSGAPAVEVTDASAATPRWRWRSTFSLVALLLLVCIAAIAMISIVHQSTWLLGELPSGSAYRAR